MNHPYLTWQEHRVADLYCAFKKNHDEIAYILDMSPHTARNRMASVAKKYGHTPTTLRKLWNGWIAEGMETSELYKNFLKYLLA